MDDDATLVDLSEGMTPRNALKVLTGICDGVSCNWPTQQKIREALLRFEALVEEDEEDDNEDRPPDGLEGHVE